MADVEVVAGASDVSVAAGDTVTLRLPENATTGYVWSIAERGAGLVLTDDRTAVVAADTAVGAGGEHLFRLRAEQPGDWRVVFRLAREWESAAHEERQLRVQVG